MNGAMRHVASPELPVVRRVRRRLIRVAAGGALVGCLYGGLAVAPAVATLATARVAPASHALAITPDVSGCGALPFPC